MTPPPTSMEADVRRILTESLAKRVEAIRSDVVKAATSEFETRVREAVGDCAIQIANYFSVERMGHELIIRVQIEANK